MRTRTVRTYVWGARPPRRSGSVHNGTQPSSPGVAIADAQNAQGLSAGGCVETQVEQPKTDNRCVFDDSAHCLGSTCHEHANNRSATRLLRTCT